MSVDLGAFNAIVKRLEVVADRLEKGGSAGASGGDDAASASDDAPIALAFDQFVKDKAAAFEAAASAAGADDIVDATKFFMRQLRFLRDILNATGKCKKPQDAEWMKFFGPVMEGNKESDSKCDNRSDFFHHRKAVNEALGIIMMVTVPGPAGHVQAVLEQCDFHAIKVMQKKEPPQTAWINALKTCLKELAAWCTENCKMGLTWKPGGEDPVAYFADQPIGSAAASASAAPKAKGKGKGGNAPPPPKVRQGPPPDQFADSKPSAKAASPQGGMAAVMAQIASTGEGDAVSKGLKKVTDDMKCKNMKDKPVLSKAAAPKAAAPRAAGGRFAKGPKGDPFKQLISAQNMWEVCNFDNDKAVTLEEGVDPKHLVQVRDCKGSTITVPARIKNIAIDSCVNCTVIVSDVMSAVELVNSERITVRVQGTVHSVSIEKTDGANIWLNKASLEAAITASKSSEMNVTIPDDKGDEYDTIEIPIPEQFVSRVVGRKLQTGVSDIYSA